MSSAVRPPALSPGQSRELPTRSLCPYSQAHLGAHVLPSTRRQPGLHPQHQHPRASGPWGRVTGHRPPRPLGPHAELTGSRPQLPSRVDRNENGGQWAEAQGSEVTSTFA